MTSQESKILSHLRAGHSLTQLQAFKRFGSWRLGARIWNLRRLGHDIEARKIKVSGKYVARYTMENT